MYATFVTMLPGSLRQPNLMFALRITYWVVPSQWNLMLVLKWWWRLWIIIKSSTLQWFVMMIQPYKLIANGLVKIYNYKIHCLNSQKPTAAQKRQTMDAFQYMSKNRYFFSNLWRQISLLCKTPMSSRTFSYVQIPIPIFWRLLKKPIWSTFWRRIALHLRGFTKIRIDSRVPYNVRG